MKVQCHVSLDRKEKLGKPGEMRAILPHGQKEYGLTLSKQASRVSRERSTYHFHPLVDSGTPYCVGRATLRPVLWDTR